MRIALVVHDFSRDFGHGRYTVELANHLPASVKVDIFSHSFSLPPQPNWTYRKVRAWRATALTSILSFLWFAEKALRRHPCDLVHAQGLTSWRADLITAHVCNAARYRTTYRNWNNPGFPAVILPLEHRFYRQARTRHLIAVSETLKRDLITEYGWRKPLHVIHHGVDCERFRPPAQEDRQRARQRFDLEQADKIWLYVGEAAKGLDLVIHALKYFPEARLLVISRSKLNRAKQAAKAQGVSTRCRWSGPIADIECAYQASDYVLCPSSYDAFGMVVSEAMAMGLPVIAGRNMGVAEWVIPGVSALLCDPEHSESLPRAILKISRNDSLASSLGQAARNTALDHSWARCARETLEVYHHLGLDP